MSEGTRTILGKLHSRQPGAESWQDFSAPAKLWKDVSKEEALELMLEGKGLLVQGSQEQARLTGSAMPSQA